MNRRKRFQLNSEVKVLRLKKKRLDIMKKRQFNKLRKDAYKLTCLYRETMRND